MPTLQELSGIIYNENDGTYVTPSGAVLVTKEINTTKKETLSRIPKTNIIEKHTELSTEISGPITPEKKRAGRKKKEVTLDE